MPLHSLRNMRGASSHQNQPLEWRIDKLVGGQIEWWQNNLSYRDKMQNRVQLTAKTAQVSKRPLLASAKRVIK